MAELQFTTAPDGEETYKVGDKVEVYCDHEKKEERVRGWLVGTVVQVDSKMIAVQFQENVSECFPSSRPTPLNLYSGRLSLKKSS